MTGRDHHRADRPRLAVDYGTATTVAILTCPGEAPTQLSFDGRPQLPSAVLVAADGQLIAGHAALDAGGRELDRLILHPARHLAEAAVTVPGRAVDPVDLVAATLWRVAADATGLAGQPVTDVTFTVPAGWGPRRRTRLRDAAERAGLSDAAFITVPEAIGGYLYAVGQPGRTAVHQQASTADLIAANRLVADVVAAGTAVVPVDPAGLAPR
jgi:molecular chaperone DnaK (HSP70)